MPYCLSCGMLRDTKGGFCDQCRADMGQRKTAEAKCERVRILREINRSKAIREDAELERE